MVLKHAPDGGRGDAVSFGDLAKALTLAAVASVRRPDQDDLESAASGIGHHLIEPWPLRLGAGNPICVLLGDLVVALCSHLAKVMQLALRVLIESRDPPGKAVILIEMPRNNVKGMLPIPCGAKRIRNECANKIAIANGSRMLMALASSAVLRWR